jgi:NitT/TauT family transport system ATP-binding protein
MTHTLDIRTPAVQVTAVSKSFATAAGHVDALRDVSLTIAPGEFVALIGPSGCGKSTLLRTIADLELPSSGSVEVFGKSAHQARLDQDYGMAFQQAALMQWRTVRENIELPLQLRKMAPAARRTRSKELIDLIGLNDFVDHRPDQLSGGMQQRVSIARALACKPSLLLMDEPLGALDEMTRERMQGELLRIAGETRAAVVFVTHSISEAVFLADQVVVMSARPGRVSAVVPVALDRQTLDETAIRESRTYYDTITLVREALRRGSQSDQVRS